MSKQDLVARLEQVCDYISDDQASVEKYFKERADLFARLHDEHGVSLTELGEIAGVTKVAVMRALQNRSRKAEGNGATD